MNTLLLGRWGESQAAGYMKKKGYKLKATNYHSRFGEIDLIVENKEYVVFVEVKLRKNGKFAEAREFVDGKKMERMILTAKQWLSEQNEFKQPRFDVVEIYTDGDTKKKPASINHLPNAFGL